MNYVWALAINFLAVFGLVRFAPGIAAAYSEPSPVGSDLLFAAITALFNASVFPVLILIGIFPTKLKLAVLNAIISFGAFTLIAMIPFGFQPNPGGVAIGGGLIWLISFLVSYFQMRRWINMHRPS